MTLDFFVQLHVTQRCNLKCRHCYQAGQCTEMSGREVKDAIDNVNGALKGWARDYRIEVSPSLHLTGGEPLLRKDIFDITAYARQAGFSVSLLTNGVLIDAAAARLIRESSVSDIQVSIEGAEKTHDGIRGRGSYSRAVLGIRNAVNEGVETNINVTVSALNCADVDSLICAAESLGAGAIAFSRLVPSGKGSALESMMLNPEEMAFFYYDLRLRQQRSRVPVISRDPLYAVMNMEDDPPNADAPVAGCAAGFFGVTIGADGSIMPCRRMDMPVGNIKTDSFRDVWAESQVLWSLRTREDYAEGCRDCRYWSVCRGCRAVALAVSRINGGNDCLAPDPQCPFN